MELKSLATLLRNTASELEKTDIEKKWWSIQVVGDETVLYHHSADGTHREGKYREYGTGYHYITLSNKISGVRVQKLVDHLNKTDFAPGSC